VKTALRILLAVLPLVLAAAGWMVGHVPARSHRTVALAELVLGPGSATPEAADTFEVRAFRMQGGDEELLRREAASIVRRFRIGCALLGFGCGLVATLKAAAMSRVPMHKEFQIESGLCVSCGRCFASCPREHVRWTEGATWWTRATSGLWRWAINMRQRPSATLVRSMLMSLGVLAAAFSAIIVVTMLRNYTSAYDLLWQNPPRMAELHRQLVESPDDELVKEAIRNEDAALRRDFFARSRQMAVGRWMLLAGAVIAVLCFHGYAWLGHRPPGPPLDAGAEEPDWEVVAKRNSHAVTCGAGVLAAAAVAVALVVPTVRLASDAGGADGAGEDASAVTLTWPRFRGPTGCGLVPEGDWPTEWNATTGKGILWAVPIGDPEKGFPADGNSSPVVWGDHVYLTSADADRNWLYCFGLRDGSVLWRTQVKSPPNSPMAGKKVEAFPDTGLAAPTPAVDARGVYVTFANADVAGIGHDGKQKWSINLGEPDTPYGLASSLVPYKNMVILQLDQGLEPSEEKSSILAMDTSTGRVIWETVRPVRSAWSTPVIARIGDRDELITAAAPLVIAYAPATGAELWRAAAIDGEVGPSPVVAGGIVFVANEYSHATAVRAGGSGDVTATHVLWRDDTDLPNIVSPLANERYYLHVHSYGAVVCYGAVDGRILWQHDFQTSMTPSPSLVGNTVYLPSRQGDMFLFDFGDRFSLKDTCKVGEKTSASPAFVEGRILIRGEKKLFCIGK
jgi:outer membrane protein assembly factor BamB/ferredoxin